MRLRRPSPDPALWHPDQILVRARAGHIEVNRLTDFEARAGTLFPLVCEMATLCKHQPHPTGTAGETRRAVP